MALRLLDDSNHYVTPQDVYNLLLLGHHVRRTDWAKDVLPFLGWRVLRARAVAAGELATCAISEAGQLVCFGNNDYVQCDVPPDLGPVVAVAAGARHTCAVKASGELVCFGHNGRGQCDVPPDLAPVVAVAAGRYHTCAVKVSGELVCFGNDDCGRCDVPPDLGPVVAVAAGGHHTCAVKASGELVCFGYNGDGQCDVPPDLGPVVAVAAGRAHTCAVKASGELVCFGYIEYSQCDVPPDLGPVVAVAAGARHTYAVKASGELVCFGDNDDGQCDVPPDLGPVVAVAAGRAHTCAVKTSGELVCFGNNHYGQCDVPPGFKVRLAPHAIRPSTLDPTQEEASWIEHNIGSGWHVNDLQSQMHAGLTRVVHMQVSAVHKKLNEVLEQSTALQPCRQALQEEGLDWRLPPSGAKIFMEPVCFRAIRRGEASAPADPRIGVIPRSSRSIAFADSDGEVVPVSRSFLNIPAVTLLNPSSVSQSTTEDIANCEHHYVTPQDVYNLRLLRLHDEWPDWARRVLPFLGWRPLRASVVAANTYTTFAISPAGQLVCFGCIDNEDGQCDVPPDLGPLTVTAGNWHTCAVKASGELVCFGLNDSGQCDVPADLGPLVAVSARGFHTCAVKASGELVCFGNNGSGQCYVPPDLGASEAISMVSATSPLDLGSVVAVAAGADCTCAVKASGELVCFGNNAFGQRDVPRDLGPMVAVAAGERHTCAVKASGELVCFGLNDSGQCDVPRDLGPVVAVAAGNVHTCAVKASGELVCFGCNGDGLCDVPPGFKVRLAPQSIRPSTSDPTQEVLQPVHHSEPPADISQEEGAAIVAEQEASWIEHNIGSGWHGDDLQSRMPTGLTRVVHLTLSRSHRRLDEELEHSVALQSCRQDLQDAGLDWRLQPSGAKVFMEPVCFRAIRSHLSTMRLRPCDIFVAEHLEEDVRRVIRQIPGSLCVFPRSSQNMAFTDPYRGVALVSRSFLHIPAVTLLNPASVAQSTTEARTRQGYHGTKPRSLHIVQLVFATVPWSDLLLASSKGAIGGGMAVKAELALLGADVAPLEDELGKDWAPVTSAGKVQHHVEKQSVATVVECARRFSSQGCTRGARVERPAGSMALRLSEDTHHYVTPQDVYNLLLLGHHVRRTDWAKRVLPFLGWRLLRPIAVAARQRATYAISEAGQLVSFGQVVYAWQGDLGPVVAVAAGRFHTCAVKASGELVCVGDNFFSHLNGQCDVPADLGPVVAVAAGEYHTCAIKASGELVGFGSNRYGQCDVPPDLGPVVAVAAGYYHTCAVKASGELVCFGDNDDGQCHVPRDLGPVVTVAAGEGHTCAVKASGELVCFGDNGWGQCNLPRDLGPVVTVAAGEGHTCAVKASGELVCFGNNDYGQCDVPADLGPVVAVAAGEGHTCAVKASGELVCFGRDEHDQCDVPPGFTVRLASQSIRALTPDPTQEVLQHVHHSEPAADISQEEGTAIVAEQEASWIEHNIGSGWHGDDLQPRMNAGLTRVVHLTLSRSHRQLCADLAESPVLQPCRQALEAEGFGWQLEPFGAKIFMEPSCFRAVRSHLSTLRLRPCDIFVAEDLEEEVMRVICSLPYSLGVVPRSSQDIAFADSDGEVVLISRSFLNIPATTLLNPSSVTQSTTEAGELRGPMELLGLHNPQGGPRLCVFGRDLHHLCWLCAHRHRKGQALPYNVADTVLRFLTVLYECGAECQSRVAATSRRTYAIDSNRELVRFGVGGDDGVPSTLAGPLSCIAVGLSHVCLLKESGDLLCYGDTVPPNLGPAVAVTAGFYHTCVLKASGELVCFGSRGPSCNVPPGLGRVIAVAAGQHHTCAVRANGELVCFGGNQRGQCDVPVDLGPVSSVAAGLSFTCAVTAHGELICFGSNSHGQCDVPPDLGPVSAVAAGYAHTCAVKSTGQLVCFGGNDYGQCDVPADLDPVVAVAAGPHHTCAMTDRGMLVCFGDNQFRQCEIPASFRLRV
ncbi:Herc4 [Symbiodinium necroappetens]|uniref:Herc4 protein n=1 Tax=Symbiodinium necroappetens TaxID=1628268 RepID=A0A812ZXU6_9DINO|nr:Herc4 [Symbiodinium necroappetens]